MATTLTAPATPGATAILEQASAREHARVAVMRAVAEMDPQHAVAALRTDAQRRIEEARSALAAAAETQLETYHVRHSFTPTAAVAAVHAHATGLLNAAQAAELAIHAAERTLALLPAEEGLF